jgi:hypothetical protein
MGECDANGLVHAKIVCEVKRFKGVEGIATPLRFDRKRRLTTLLSELTINTGTFLSLLKGIGIVREERKQKSPGAMWTHKVPIMY